MATVIRPATTRSVNGTEVTVLEGEDNRISLMQELITEDGE